MGRILIVCTGNICRSPAAEALLKDRLAQEGLDDWVVESAGTWTVDGRPPSPQIVGLMAQRGLDIAAYRSQEIDARMVEAADIILVMTQGHAEALRMEFPDHAHKVFLLGEMKDGVRREVDDPYGGSLEEYQTAVEEIEELIDAGFERIRAIVEKGS